MKNFDAWFRDAGRTEPEQSDVPEELLDGGSEDPRAEGGWTFPCRSCGEYSDIMCDPSEFNPNHHYCGRSPMCCP